MIDPVYRQQVDLLLQVLPLVAKETQNPEKHKEQLKALENTLKAG